MLKFLKKDYLVGMGAGFIISGFMIAYFGIGQPTDDEIRARAAKLGMTMQLSTEKEQSQPDKLNSLPGQDRPNKDTSDNVSHTTGSAENPTSTEKPVSTAKPISTEKPVTNPAVNDDVSKSEQKLAYAVVEIKPGMGSETVARILEEKGVVKDRNEFYNLVTIKKAHSRFKVGKFSVPVGGDMEYILGILTRKQ